MFDTVNSIHRRYRPYFIQLPAGGGAMGFASSFELGLAVSVPEREIWILDSDGGAAMNAGGTAHRGRDAARKRHAHRP
jgi:thiamine pyrophosphate-dependent acetolactate synthase large subunit-like protein